MAAESTGKNEPVTDRQAGPPGGADGRLVGQVTYIYAYDVAYELARQPIASVLGQPVAQFRFDVNPRLPKDVFFYFPQMFRLSDVQRQGRHGPLTLRRVVKLFPVGAISVAIHVPFAVERIEDLAAFHDLHVDGRPLQQEVRELANEVLAELRPLLTRPVEQVRDEEAYTVFCLDSGAMVSADAEFDANAWLSRHRRAVAGLLNDDRADLLSEPEVFDTTSHQLSYRRDDLVVMDWDAALVVDRSTGLDEVLHVMELANVQLAELEAYDRTLDAALDRGYRDVARPPRSSTATLRTLREIRLDLSRLSDELSNTTKFFGDWHLARIYQRLFVLFHLGDWQRTIGEKLRNLGELYHLLRQDQTNRLMVVLELTIVLLFIIDVILLVIGVA